MDRISFHWIVLQNNLDPVHACKRFGSVSPHARRRLAFEQQSPTFSAECSEMHFLVAKLVPCLILLLAITGWRATWQLGMHLLDKHALRAWTLLGFFHVALLYAAAAYYTVAFGSRRPRPARTSEPHTDAMPHEIVEPRFCTKDACNGSVRAPRSRHCAHHKVCRPGEKVTDGTWSTL
jgi:hypothetical protein